jgi:hypothetical protein
LSVWRRPCVSGEEDAVIDGVDVAVLLVFCPLLATLGLVLSRKGW